MNIIAFTGKRGYGKSTAAEALVRQYGYVHLNFADPLREVCALVYGVTFEEMLDPVLKEQTLDRWPYKSPRELLQQIGTDMFRDYISDTWIENWKNRVQAALSPFEVEVGATDGLGNPMRAEGGIIFSTPGAPGVVCSDCRFLNEAEAVKALGGKLIMIDDPRKVRTDAASLHQSEMEIDLLPVDWTIRNDRGVHDLEVAAVLLADGTVE